MKDGNHRLGRQRIRTTRNVLEAVRVAGLTMGVGLDSLRVREGTGLDSVDRDGVEISGTEAKRQVEMVNHGERDPEAEMVNHGERDPEAEMVNHGERDPEFELESRTAQITAKEVSVVVVGDPIIIVSSNVLLRGVLFLIVEKSGILKV